MSEDDFVSACLRMEEAYTAIRQARPMPGSPVSHTRIVQLMQVIRACRQQLISGVGARRASFFERLIKAQVLENELASDDSLTHSHQNPDACRPLAASSGRHSSMEFYQ